MNDGSRHFGELDFVALFDVMREHLKKLADVRETGFVTDWVTEMWIDFEYNGHFSLLTTSSVGIGFLSVTPPVPIKFLGEYWNTLR